MTPPSSPQTPTRPVHQCLSFSSDSDQDPDSTPVYSDQDPDSTPVYLDRSDEEEEDFQTVPLDDEHWTLEEVHERTFCIHENGLPHNSCQYPCPYGSNDTVSYMDSLDLKWHFGLWRLHGHLQWWRITGNGRGTLLTLNSGLLEHLLKIPILILCE